MSVGNPWSFFKNIYVISLKEATDRRAAMKAHLDAFEGLSYTILDGVNGKKNPYLRKSYEDRGITNRYPCSDGLLGCLASHRMIWERIFTECDDATPTWTLVMEDDALFHPAFTAAALAKYTAASPSNALFLKFGYLATEAYSNSYIPINRYWTSFNGAQSFSTICYAIRSDLTPHLLKHQWTQAIDWLTIPQSYGAINLEDALGDDADYSRFRNYYNPYIKATEPYHGLVAAAPSESQTFAPSQTNPLTPKLLVFMSDNRLLDAAIETAEYHSLAAVINAEYCKRHKYDFVYYRPYLDRERPSLYNCLDPATKEERHASWSKLLTATRAFNAAYDYIVYIDSDCIFKTFRKSLEELIGPHADKDMIFLNNKPWHIEKPCGGFFVCKVNESAKQFIRDWYNVKIPEKNKVHAWEQDALWTLYKNYNLAIVDSTMFYEEEDQFLRHVSSVEKQIRVPYFKRFIETNKIDFSKNINAIVCVEFSTVSDEAATPSQR